VLVVAGIVVIAASGSVLAEAVSISLVSLGLIVMISLMFFEVGLSEDRERARETERRRRDEDRPPDPRRLTPSRRRRRRS
jgi:hypothetical protein